MLGKYSDKGATDRALSALNHPIRRRLLFSLYEKDEHASEARPHVDPFQEVGPDATQAALYHVHLPKLAEPGYVSWDTREDTITVGPNWDTIEPLLRLVYQHLNELPPRLRGTRSPVERA